MAKIPIQKKEIEGKECPTCGQKTHYVSSLNKGMVETLRAFFNAVRLKRLNDIRMAGMVVDHKTPEWADLGTRTEAGRITHSQYDNHSHMRAHGLIAELGEPNHYCLTKKGMKLLRGEPVEAHAVVEKRTHSNVGYVAHANGELVMTDIRQIMKSGRGWWDNWEYDIAPDGSLEWHDPKARERADLV